MSSETVVLEDEYLEAAYILRLNIARRKEIDLEDARAREILAKVLAEGETGTDPDGQPLVQVRAGARVWSEAAARENLPGDLLAGITVTETLTRLDKVKAKDTLAPALYALCTKSNKPSVVTL